MVISLILGGQGAELVVQVYYLFTVECCCLSPSADVKTRINKQTPSEKSKKRLGVLNNTSLQHGPFPSAA